MNAQVMKLFLSFLWPFKSEDFVIFYVYLFRHGLLHKRAYKMRQKLRRFKFRILFLYYKNRLSRPYEHLHYVLTDFIMGFERSSIILNAFLFLFNARKIDSYSFSATTTLKR